ncbi:MAG: LysM peptidoglycan-binding domain-containing protein, partial [Chloroflexi bacterium]|nr:LysM peptidoglycan-binding domain-containing protein [Chloroflexota bacterium]
YSLLTAGDCSASLYQFQMAQAMRPNGEEVRMGLDLLNRYCATPAPPTATFTPAPTPGPTHTPGTPTPTPTGLAEPIQYTVQRGDTLFSLAKRYSTSVQAIMQANGMMSHLIRVGQVIWIPASQPPPGPIVHIVQPGETLYSIARLYNTTVWAISVANQLQGYSIYAYQALYVPSAQQPGAMIHIVQPGETLFTIARIHKTTVPLLMLANGLQNYHLVVYQRVLIPPAGWTGWPPLWPGGYPPGGMPVPQVHVVKAGETLFSIAQRYGVTVAALRAANGLKGSTIYVGQTLRLP